VLTAAGQAGCRPHPVRPGRGQASLAPHPMRPWLRQRIAAPAPNVARPPPGQIASAPDVAPPWPGQFRSTLHVTSNMGIRKFTRTSCDPQLGQRDPVPRAPRTRARQGNTGPHLVRLDITLSEAGSAPCAAGCRPEVTLARAPCAAHLPCAIRCPRPMRVISAPSDLLPATHARDFCPVRNRPALHVARF
jgi:hypothetical protein